MFYSQLDYRKLAAIKLPYPFKSIKLFHWSQSTAPQLTSPLSLDFIARFDERLNANASTLPLNIARPTPVLHPSRSHVFFTLTLTLACGWAETHKRGSLGVCGFAAVISCPIVSVGLLLFGLVACRFVLCCWFA